MFYVCSAGSLRQVARPDSEGLKIIIAMIKVNWLRLLLCMVITATVTILLEKYFNIHTSKVIIAGLGIVVGRLCIQWNFQKN